MHTDHDVDFNDQQRLSDLYRQLASVAASSAHHAELAHRRLLAELDQVCQRLRTRRGQQPARQPDPLAALVDTTRH